MDTGNVEDDMAFEEKRGLVGVSFSDNMFNMVEVEITGGQYQINKIAKIPMDQPFDIKQYDNNQVITHLSDMVNQAVESCGIMFEKTAFSLDSQMVIVKKVPIDSGFSDIETKEQIDWEVEQFILEPKEQFIIDYSQLSIDPKSNFKEILIVAVRKPIVDFILNIFSGTKLKLEYIDVDVFAATRAIRMNYEIRESEKIALVNIAHDKIVMALLRGGEFLLSNEFMFFKESNGEKGTLPPTDEEMAKLISKEIRRLILDHKMGENIEDLNRVFLYGEMVKDEVLETLQNYYDVRIDKANPFRRLRFSSDVNVDDQTRAKPEAFVLSIGSAMRDM